MRSLGADIGGPFGDLPARLGLAICDLRFCFLAFFTREATARLEEPLRLDVQWGALRDCPVRSCSLSSPSWPFIARGLLPVPAEDHSAGSLAPCNLVTLMMS